MSTVNEAFPGRETQVSRKSVIAVRLDGRRVLFGTYETSEAERVAASLRGMQLGAEVIDAPSVDMAPGAAVESISQGATP